MLDESAHRRLAVDGPDKDLLACCCDFMDGRLRSKALMQHNETNWKALPFRKLTLVLADQAEWNLRRLGMESDEDFWQERRHDQSALRRKLTQQRARVTLQSRDFEFDIEKGAARVAFQDLMQRGEVEVADAGLGDVHAAGFCVVADHRLAVGGEANVKLEPITSVREAEIEGCERVFRDGLVRARAAMAEQKWPRGHGC